MCAVLYVHALMFQPKGKWWAPGPCRCEYPVASRPAAIRDWLKSDDVKGQWIFMVETDYIFVK